MKFFPYTFMAWQRLKLLWAELLVVTVMKGDHSYGHQENAKEAANSIREFREMYYSERKVRTVSRWEIN